MMMTTSVYASVTVVLVAPKAGDYVQQGKELEKGVTQAINEINQNGGLLGKKIDLLTVDDQCSDSIAVSTAQMITLTKEKKIGLIIGPYCANSFEQVADIYAKAGIFQIIPTTVNYLQAKTIKKGLVKMLGFTNQQAHDFFAYYNSTFAGNSVALISNKNEEESVEEAQAIKDEFRKHGKSVVLNEYTYDMTNNDFQKLAEKIIADGNNMAFILGTAKNIRKTVKFLKEDDENFVVFTNKYTATQEYFAYLGDLANGTYMMELRGKDDDPEFAETLVKLRLNGFDAEGLSLYGYSAVKLWKNIVQQTKSFEYGKLANYLNNRRISTEFGEKMFHNGVPSVNESYSIYKYENGTANRVY